MVGTTMGNIRPGEAVAARKQAEEAFSSGLNCCESMLTVSIDLLGLDLPPRAVKLGRFFRQGVGETGCICGALAGGVMVIGYLLHDHPRGLEAVQRFEAGFRERNKSACCRVIRKNQGMLGKLYSRECKNLTGNAAKLLVEIIADFQVENMTKGG